MLKVLAKIAKEGSRVLEVTPHWNEAPWYGFSQELTVRSYEWRGRLCGGGAYTFDGGEVGH